MKTAVTSIKTLLYRDRLKTTNAQRLGELLHINLEDAEGRSEEKFIMARIDVSISVFLSVLSSIFDRTEARTIPTIIIKFNEPSYLLESIVQRTVSKVSFSKSHFHRSNPEKTAETNYYYYYTGIQRIMSNLQQYYYKN